MKLLKLHPLFCHPCHTITITNRDHHIYPNIRYRIHECYGRTSSQSCSAVSTGSSGACECKARRGGSAPQFHSQINSKVLSGLIPEWSNLDPMVRVRLLLALLASPASRAAAPIKAEDSTDHRAAASRVVALGLEDDDEWVRVVARAMGDLSGQLDLETVLEGSPVVSDSICLHGAICPPLATYNKTWQKSSSHVLIQRMCLVECLKCFL